MHLDVSITPILFSQFSSDFEHDNLYEQNMN